MSQSRARFAFVIIGLIVTHLLAGVAGFLLMLPRGDLEKSALVMSCFMDDLAALSYLEKGNADNAKHSLRVAIEGNVLNLGRYGATAVEKQNPEAKKKLFAHYESIRKKYPPIDYRDDGSMNRRIDQALAATR